MRALLFDTKMLFYGLNWEIVENESKVESSHNSFVSAITTHNKYCKIRKRHNKSDIYQIELKLIRFSLRACYHEEISLCMVSGHINKFSHD